MNLKEYRLKQGWSQRVLAQKCGVNTATICQIEIGRNLPSLTLFATMALNLKVPPKKLLGLFFEEFAQ